MLEVFMYPVSGILKLWHLLFASFLDESMAWLVNSALNTGLDDRLTREPLAVTNSHVGGEDDGISRIDESKVHVVLNGIDTQLWQPRQADYLDTLGVDKQRPSCRQTQR